MLSPGSRSGLDSESPGEVAQSVEHTAENRGVVGSIPTLAISAHPRMDELSPKQPVAVIGAPLDLGQDRRGVDMGPSAIRYAGLEQSASQASAAPATTGGTCRTAGGGGRRRRATSSCASSTQIKTTCAEVATLVRRAGAEGMLPLVLGGDHSVALGTLAGLREDGPGGVLWVDAHGDLNTPETSVSGNVHGMVLAAALGLGGPAFEHDAWTLPLVDPSRVALVGVRSLDDAERLLLRELGAVVYTMSDLDRLGVERAMRRGARRTSRALASSM